MAARKPAKKKVSRTRARPALTRERVLRAALSLADRGGVEALSMRSVAAALGVEAMSLYNHVEGKDDLMMGVADLVLSEIEIPPPGTPWRQAMRQRALSARDVFVAHPSSAIIVESCTTMTPARLAYSDAIAGLLMADGFSPKLAYRAFLLLDSYLYGFTMQELSWPHPASPADEPAAVEVPADRFPHFARLMREVMSTVGAAGLVKSYADEFVFGLELLLDALEGQRALERAKC